MTPCEFSLQAVLPRIPLTRRTQGRDDVDGVEAGPHAILTQATLAVTAFLAHQVATIGLAVFDLAVGGYLKPLGKTLVCFSRHRHGCVPLQTRSPVRGEAG